MIRQDKETSRLRTVGRGRSFAARVIPAVLLFSFLITQVLSCAYYNTFYSARKYYDQAMSSKELQSRTKTPGAASPSSVTIANQIAPLLDKAIEKCAKVISVYPKSKWVDDAVFLMGECYYEKRDYDRAIKKFNELGVYYPKSPLLVKAQFLTGMCYLGKNDYDQASEILYKFLKEHPRSGDRDAALYARGDAAFQRGRYPEALPYYRLLAGNRKSRLYFETLVKVGECYFQIAKYDSCRISLAPVVARSRDDEQVLDAMTRIGDAFSAQRDFDAAVRQYEKALPLAKMFSRTPNLKLKMASATSQKGDYKKAIEMYQSVVEESPKTIQAAEAQFRIGYIDEVNLEDLEAAATAYSRVKDQTLRSEFATLADLRSKGLAKLKEFNQAAKSSEGEKAAESEFLIAELSLFQLGKPDRAVEKYLDVEKNFPATRFAPKAAYAAAYVDLYMRQDTVSAISILKRVVEKYPSSEYAQAAVDLLKSLGQEPPEIRVSLPLPETSGAGAQRADTLAARKINEERADTLATKTTSTQPADTVAVKTGPPISNTPERQRPDSLSK